VFVVDGEGGGEDSLAVWGDAVEAGTSDFGAEAVASEFVDEPGDPCTASTLFVSVRGGAGVEVVNEVVVAEADDGVASGQHGSEEGLVGGLEGVEAGQVASVSVPAPAQGAERGDAFAIGLRGGESFEVAPVGPDAHLEVPPHVGYALVHRAPPPLAPAVVVGEDAQHPELN
jgi:hypothetical protein